MSGVVIPAKAGIQNQAPLPSPPLLSSPLFSSLLFSSPLLSSPHPNQNLTSPAPPLCPLCLCGEYSSPHYSSLLLSSPLPSSPHPNKNPTSPAPSLCPLCLCGEYSSPHYSSLLLSSPPTHGSWRIPTPSMPRCLFRGQGEGWGEGSREWGWGHCMVVLRWFGPSIPAHWLRGGWREEKNGTISPKISGDDSEHKNTSRKREAGKLPGLVRLDC